MKQLLKVKKVGDSFDLRLPPAFVKANKLRTGDYVVVDIKDMRLLHAEDFATAGREPVVAEVTE
jgi:antitoxin component of MazEF toxin-antitoxin module